MNASASTICKVSVSRFRMAGLTRTRPSALLPPQAPRPPRVRPRCVWCGEGAARVIDEWVERQVVHTHLWSALTSATRRSSSSNVMVNRCTA